MKHDAFFTLNPRRKPTNLFVQPALQLRLPLYLTLISLGMALMVGGYTYMAFGELLGMAIRESNLESVIAAQTQRFVRLTAVISVGYVIVVGVACVVYLHRMVGPMVAFRRHLEALKNGDYTSRVSLRDGDAFTELASDLNELSEILQRDEKQRTHAAS